MKKSRVQQGSLINILNMPNPVAKVKPTSATVDTAGMSNLEALIAQLCPNGVEYKTLGDIANVARGASPRPIQKYITNNDDGVNWIKIGDVSSDSKYITSTKEMITPEGARNSRYVKEGDFILSNSMSFGRPYIMKISGCIHDGWLSISNFEETYITDFLYYLLSSTTIQKKFEQKASIGTMRNLNADIVKSINIPIPPIQVQEEIVRILDTFSELTANLAAELTKRKQQYQYYIDKLLKFNNVKEILLNDLVEYRRGSFPQPYGNTEWYGGEESYPFVQVVDILDNSLSLNKMTKQTISKLAQSKSVFVEKGTVIASLQGTIGRVAITQYDTYVDRTIVIFEKYKIKVNKKYFAYQLKKIFSSEKRSARGTTLKTMTKEDIKDFKIPLPPLAEQERIVSILDRFDALCNDLTSGLPAEIEARKKQYEYYRDKLLTFKELSA